MGERPHIPVLLGEVLDHLRPSEGETYIDGTFGAGGYSAAILDAADCTVVAMDRDPGALPRAETMTSKFAPRFRFVAGEFSTLDQISDVPVDGVVLDIGVSSMQIDQADRGFSFMKDGPLDMRMGRAGPTAADLINTMELSALARIFKAFGEEKYARPIAKAILARRETKPFETTTELAELIEAQTPVSKRGPIHPATRVFQALRIAVNRELEELVLGLEAAERALSEGGRLVVVSFHSLEDRIVKNYLREAGEAAAPSRHLPSQSAEPARFESVTRRAVQPSDAEVASNPRSRSAKLRSAIRTSAPAKTASKRLHVLASAA
ncbi:MAG: 16S rRNA (cytosine(1402)-N(4))-methyltransferase RsmH [Pseudomonadota bacterium]